MCSGSVGEAQRVRQLVVVFAPSRHLPPAVTLGSGPLVIGRDRHATLMLDDEGVSRRHAEVRYDASADRWVVGDCGSRNGLWIDGARVEQAALRHGTVLRIGRTLLVSVDVVVTAGRQLRHETQALRGHSVAMQQVRGEIATLADQRIPLLVLGETGVGKELVARDLHARSGRSGPFVLVSCAAIPSGLTDSMLFGHPVDSLASAASSRDGLFGQARGGTLFLDEIGELPAAIQPKLLRALTVGEVRSVDQSAQLDVQVVAATHRDLAKDVTNGGFRPDLYSRLAGWVLRVPPLRERRDDILGLARAVLDRWHGGKLGLSALAAEALLLHDWPFNVRELEHAIATAAVRAEGDAIIRCRYLPPAIGDRVLARQGSLVRGVNPGELAQGTVTPSKEELRQLLVEHGGNVLHAARALKKDRQQLYRWLKRYAIDVAAIRSEQPTDD